MLKAQQRSQCCRAAAEIEFLDNDMRLSQFQQRGNDARRGGRD
jgi:hypothetical protein